MTAMQSTPHRSRPARHDVVRALTMAAALLLPAAASEAQSRIGVIGGATFATLRGVDNLDQRDGAMGGLSVLFPVVGAFALQAELLGVTKGARGTIGSSTNGVKLTYAEVPLLLRFTPSPGVLSPHVYAGPYVGLRINCTLQGGDTDCDDVGTISTRSADVGGIVGGGLDLSLGSLILTGGARYGFGVSKVIDFDVNNVRESATTGTFALYAGVSIRLGSR